MRADGLYDLVIQIDHNTRPRVAGRGSAVFLHVARPGFKPTAGCVALRPRDLKMLVRRIGPNTRIQIHI
jgi:L,D-peptidoglycan transpeptidase YkuD (ErfK/YbiS/YcfS/YnhG family)